MNIKRLIEIGSYRGLPSSPQPAGPRTAHPYQRAHPQRSAQGNSRQQEESGGEDLRNQLLVSVLRAQSWLRS